jgi:hypothetical protein
MADTLTYSSRYSKRSQNEVMSKIALALVLVALCLAPAPAGWADGSRRYQGICDMITGGCAEGWDMTRAVTANYNGPLFQIALFSRPHRTMNVGQTSRHTVDMTAVLSFCGGSYSNCAISKMYAQIRGHSNDAVPNFLNGSAANAPPNCGNRNGNGPLSCACPLTVDAKSGVPINPLNTAGIECQYTLVNDQPGAGIIGGTSSDISNVLIGQSASHQTQSCSMFGSMHCHNCNDTQGQDFGLSISYGFGPYVSCSTSNGYCLFADLESNGKPTSNSISSSQFYAVGMMSWAHSTNILSGVTNGHQAWTPQAPQATQDTGTSIHIGGGGDMCSTGSFNFFEGVFTNSVISNADYNSVLANVRAAYPSVTFP